jgi:polysaccharide biosynthesis transport protein
VRVANAIVDAFLEEQARAQSDAARQATQMLTARLDDLRKRAVDSEERVEEFKRKNNILSASGQLVVEQQVSTINNQLVLARARAADAQARFNQISAIRKGGGDVSAISEATGSQTREAELAATLMPKHPALLQVRQQVRKIAAEIDAEVRRIAEATSREYQRAQGSEASLLRSLNEVKGDLVQTNDKLVALREIERDAEANRVVYEAALKRTQEMSEQGKVPLANTRVISRATPAEHRSMPPSKAILGLAGLLLGSLAGFGLAFAFSKRDQRPRAAV